MPEERFESLPEYEIRRCVARGGMSEVYLAHGLDGWLRDADVILKRLHPMHRTDRAFTDLFTAEARLGEQIVHPHIAQTYELLLRDEELFIVQEYVDGCTLAELGKWGNASRESLLTAFDDLGHALDHLHGGKDTSTAIIHRDVNPQNLVVRTDGICKLVDFGIAEAEGRPDHRRTGALAGTPAYMSPEQARGEVLDRRSDVFSAGIVLWELLQGTPLFHRATEFDTLHAICKLPIPQLTRVPPEVCNAFEPTVSKALARKRDDRFASAAELVTAFESACAKINLRFDRVELGAAVHRARAERTPPEQAA